MKELDTLTTKLIEKHIDKIDRNDFITLFDRIISKHDLKECEKVFNAMKSAGIGEGETGIDKIKKAYYSNHRIKKIKCYNVGFGDCFLCKDNNENGPKMLVDCGEHRSFNNLAVLNDVYDELIMAKQKNLMISHLHQDHYNGVSQLLATHQDLKFDNVYLPNYISNGSLELYASTIFLDPNSDLAREARYVLQIPGILQKNCTPNARIYFLSEGGKAFNSLCVFEALLPKNNRERLWNENIEPIREFCERYKEILGYVENESGSVTVSINLEESISELVEKFYNQASEKYERVSKSKINELKKRFKTNRNELSLAFHEFGVENSKNVLFLGDSEPKDINYLVDNKKLNNEYCFVKVQHHGTRKYFYNKLPKANWFAISNGGNRHPWEITKDYDYQYGKSTNFICTNNCNCEKFKNNIICDAYKKLNTKCGVNLSCTVKI